MGLDLQSEAAGWLHHPKSLSQINIVVGCRLLWRMNTYLWDDNNIVTLTAASYFPFVIMSCPKRSHTHYDANVSHRKQYCGVDRLPLWGHLKPQRERKWGGGEMGGALVY